MPTVVELALAKKLEDAFRIEFEARVNSEAGKTILSARPVSSKRDQLRIEAELPSSVRLFLRVMPESFSRPLIDTMSQADLNHRMRAADDLARLNERAYACLFNVNDISLLEYPANDWPPTWNSFLYEVHIRPLAAHDSSEELLDECFNWMVATLRPLFDLVDVVLDVEGFAEGGVQKTLANKYERNPNNRRLCLAAKGYSCQICGFNFERAYGNLGRDFIHVHHIVPVSQMGPGYVVDPINDLIPVCPNCHAMLHRVDPPLRPEDLKKIVINTNKSCLLN